MPNRGRRVLIVDDQRGVRLTLAGIIEDLGYDVTEVGSGYDAIKSVRKSYFDIIFMDMKMPGINGLQTYRQIKGISPGSVVVMMTGFAIEEQLVEALNEGAYSVIYKPFDPETVVRLVGSVKRTVVVLVVDDRSADRAGLLKALNDKGYRVGEASDGVQALQLTKESQYDIVMMDIKASGMTAASTFQEIKALDPEARVIFAAGLPMDGSISDALDSALPEGLIEADNILALIRKSMMDRSDV